MTLHFSQPKVEEINEIIEMKLTHRKNIDRRKVTLLVPDKMFCIVVVSIPYQLKAKFGFDSVSKMGLNMVGAAVVVPDASDGTEPENPYDGNKQTRTIRSRWKDEMRNKNMHHGLNV